METLGRGRSGMADSGDADGSARAALFPAVGDQPAASKWLARDGSEPYRLFALSNVGALLALAAYPLLIEPRIPTHAQDSWWSYGFAAFAVLCGAAAWLGSPQSEVPLEDVSPEPRQSSVPWLLLAAAGSMMLVSTTNQLTQNVAAVPFLWILPLAVGLSSLAYAVYDIQVSEAIPGRFHYSPSACS
jgi:hypothetical protein